MVTKPTFGRSRSSITNMTLQTRKAVMKAGSQSWIRKSAQDDKWSFCLKAVMMAANRRNDEQTTAPEPHTGIQGQGGARRRQGRSNAGSAGGAFRCSPQSDYAVEGAPRGWGL